MRKNAFTLAEILIALVVIGIIAAMTIPLLMGKTNNKEIETARNKVLSTASKALGLEYSLYGKQPNGNNEELAIMLKNHMAVVDDCIGEDCTYFMLADGMYYYIDEGFSFLVDVNGVNKGQNSIGEDVFRFRVVGRKVMFCEDGTCESLQEEGEEVTGENSQEEGGGGTLEDSQEEGGGGTLEDPQEEVGEVGQQNSYCDDAECTTKTIDGKTFDKIALNDKTYYIHKADTDMEWIDAIDYCPEGSSLPDIETLQTLAEENITNSCIFNGTSRWRTGKAGTYNYRYCEYPAHDSSSGLPSDSFYWSSTTHATDYGDYAFGVLFETARVNYSDQIEQWGDVLCVGN